MILAIDQGTTGTTVLVMNRRGRVAARAYAVHALALHGRKPEGALHELFGARERMPLSGKAHLLRAAALLRADAGLQDTLAQELLKLNAFLLLGVVFALAFLAYKLFAFVLRVLLTGIAFAFFPLIANLVGIAVPLTLQSILWSAITGMVVYLAYLSIKFGHKIISAVFYPFRKTFKKQKK